MDGLTSHSTQGPPGDVFSDLTGFYLKHTAGRVFSKDAESWAACDSPWRLAGGGSAAGVRTS